MTDQKPTAWVRHIAGKYESQLQTCVRCAIVLIDDRDFQWHPDLGKRIGFPRGSAVYQDGKLFGNDEPPEDTPVEICGFSLQR